MEIKRSIIFCQASAKVASVLKCYEHERCESRKVQIIVCNVPNLVLFFEYLHLDAEILSFDKIRNKRFQFWKKTNLVKKNLASLCLDKESDIRIFFTDIYEDLNMGLYLKYLAAYQPTHILSHLEISERKVNGGKILIRKGLPFKFRVKELIYTCIYGYSFKYTLEERWVIALNAMKYNYPQIDYSDKSVISKYRKTICDTKQRSVLLFTEPYRNKFQTEENYDMMNKKIITVLHENGYKVYVKGHPSLGCYTGILGMCDFEIPSYIPSEYLDISAFEFAIGFVSTALCSASEVIKAYSVLPMCEIINDKEEEYWENYLVNMKGGNVIFINDFFEIV